MKIEINERIYATIEQDDCSQAPDWYESVKIAYRKSSRYTLGNHGVSVDEMQEIEEKIESGELVGLPVYAYVHSGVALSTSPFGDPWDSGQSGFVFADPKRMAKEFGEDFDFKEILESAVKDLSTYLQGDVYVIRVFVDGEEKDVIGGHYGLEYAKQEAKELAEIHAKLLERKVRVVTAKTKLELSGANIADVRRAESKLKELNAHCIVVGDPSDPIEVTQGGAIFWSQEGEVALFATVELLEEMLDGKEVPGFKKEGDAYVEITV
jgi:hypothetical protein